MHGSELLCSESTLGILSLELTGKCNLECVHCYADSGPMGTHGSMSSSEWLSVISQAFELGCRRVQFIGGEPTLHPDLESLIRRAYELGMCVEVYSNLVTVPDRLWKAFDDCKVELATSFYSSNAGAHDRVTGRTRSQVNTLSNIAVAAQHGRSVRVGITSIFEDQELAETTIQLRAAGVTGAICLDELREVGRGQRNKVGDPHTLCGNCVSAIATITPEGQVFPCVFSRWLPIGNVKTESLAEIMAGPARQRVIQDLTTVFQSRLSAASSRGCNPDCNPTWCSPNNCNPSQGLIEAGVQAAGCAPQNCNPGWCSPNNCNPSQGLIEVAEEQEQVCSPLLGNTPSLLTRPVA